MLCNRCAQPLTVETLTTHQRTYCSEHCIAIECNETWDWLYAEYAKTMRDWGFNAMHAVIRHARDEYGRELLFGATYEGVEIWFRNPVPDRIER